MLLLNKLKGEISNNSYDSRKPSPNLTEAVCYKDNDEIMYDNNMVTVEKNDEGAREGESDDDSIVI